MKIYLIGMPLSGKSTIGKLLSKQLKFKFLDLDKFIEDTYQISIDELLLNNQKHTFRLLEEKALKECLKKDNIVISTGGGIVEKESNVLLMEGPKIFLDVPLKVLEQRKKTSKKRPLLQLTSLESLYYKRIDKYNSFKDILIKEEQIDKTIKAILNALIEKGFI